VGTSDLHLTVFRISNGPILPYNHEKKVADQEIP